MTCRHGNAATERHRRTTPRPAAHRPYGRRMTSGMNPHNPPRPSSVAHARCRSFAPGAIRELRSNRSCRPPGGGAQSGALPMLPSPRSSAIPIPLGGGNLHNKVVYHAMKVLNDPAWGLGWPVLRFNFRGAGLSEGSHDGRGRIRRCACRPWTGSNNEFRRPTHRRRIQFWRSHGAAGLLRPHSGTSATHVRALIALGLPTRPRPAYRLFLPAEPGISQSFSSAATATSLRPLAQLVERGRFRRRTRSWLILLPGADHFFTGQLEPRCKARSCRMAEGAIAMTPVSDSRSRIAAHRGHRDLHRRAQRPATSRRPSTAASALRATPSTACCPTAAGPRPSISPRTSASS